MAPDDVFSQLESLTGSVEPELTGAFSSSILHHLPLIYDFILLLPVWIHKVAEYRY